ncbi:MAG: hypothetical protein SGJ27_03305 [Candidatus Melainabacteria bacterium]|nr:hypothetical protein [Candidatus Melainabacteria bacterium]
MASPQVTVRLDPDTYKTLIKLAELEKKTVAEMTRALIEQGLGKRQTIEDDLISELRMVRMELGELTAKSVKLGGIAAYYARLATIFTAETMHFTTNNGQPMPAEMKKERALQWKEESRQQAKKLLEANFDEI